MGREKKSDPFWTFHSNKQSNKQTEKNGKFTVETKWSDVKFIFNFRSNVETIFFFVYQKLLYLGDGEDSKLYPPTVNDVSMSMRY